MMGEYDFRVTLLGTGEPPLRIVHMIRRQFRLLARAKALSEDGVPRPEIASGLKVPPFVARKLEEQAGKMGLPYDAGRLLTDTGYNTKLGSSYFQRRLDQNGNPAPRGSDASHILPRSS